MKNRIGTYRTGSCKVLHDRVDDAQSETCAQRISLTIDLCRKKWFPDLVSDVGSNAWPRIGNDNFKAIFLIQPRAPAANATVGYEKVTR